MKKGVEMMRQAFQVCFYLNQSGNFQEDDMPVSIKLACQDVVCKLGIPREIQDRK
jgi:hypothetical protein